MERQQRAQPQQQAGGQQAGGQQPPDCLQCRVVGTGVCLAASAYLGLSHWAAPTGGMGRAHRVAMLGAAAGFFVLGVARALM